VSDLNLCQFIGRAGRDPEVRYAASGDAIVNFTLAVGWKSKDKEGTEWVRCTAFGKLAEVIGQYVQKGKQVYVSGRWRTREWTDKDGVKHYTTELNVDQLQLLGSKDDGKAAPKARPKDEAWQAGAKPGNSDSDEDGPPF
jgi:single-strand DNA-binding protein